MSTDPQQVGLPEPQRVLPPSNLRYAFALLPKEKRVAMQAIYAFCRYTDDLVDEGDATLAVRTHLLDAWRSEIEAAYGGKARHPVMRPMQEVVLRFSIDKQLLLSLVEGVAMDLHKKRYQTWEELREYCYAVASVVGLMSMEVFGYTHPNTRKYAIDLGYALQITNILRDVREDAERGRIYLPLEDLYRFEYSEQELMEGQYNERFVYLMRFEAERAKAFYREAREHLQPADFATMFPSRVMDATYSRLLSKMEAAQFDVFSHRFRVSSLTKVFYLLLCRFA